jgi:hypothetical protein
MWAFLVIIVVLCVMVGVWYELRHPAQYEYICPNCGTVRKSFIPPRSKRKNLCPACSHSQLIPTHSARGREIREIYHGGASVEGYFRRMSGAEEDPTEKLDGAASPTETVEEPERLDGLVRVGALTASECSRAKAAMLGKPKDKQAEAIDRVLALYRAHHQGLLSQSEFNLEKWEILSLGGPRE